MTARTSGYQFDVVYIPSEKIQAVYPLVANDVKKTLDKANNGYDHNLSLIHI